MDKRIEQRRMKVLQNEQQEMIKEHGWFMHYVFEHHGELNGLANIHTHGLKENFNHPDIQVVLPLPPEVIHGVFSGIVEDVKNGRAFKPDVATKEVLQGYDVYFKEYTENGRKVLRLILPDPQGKFPFDEDCLDDYKSQFDVLPEI